MNKQKTISTQLIKAVTKFWVEEIGQEKVDKALVESGLSEELYSNPNYRITVNQISLVLKKIGFEKFPPYFGLKQGKRLEMTELGIPGMFFLYSETLRAALEKQLKYGRIISDFSQITVIENAPDTCQIVFIKPDAHPYPHLIIQTYTTLYVRTILRISEQKIKPQKAWLNIPHPKENAHLFEAIYQCPIIYDNGITALEYKSKDLDQNLYLRNEELLTNLEVIAQKNFQDLPEEEEKEITNNVQNLIKKNIYMRNTVLSISNIADLLGIRVRSLQRKLRNEGSSYSIILNEVRKNEAIALLKTNRLNINEIAWFLGYSEVSSFVNQFKKWTHLSPLQYRSKVIFS